MAFFIAFQTASARADVSCTTTITGTTVKGNLDVPKGSICTLNGTTVTGNVTVEGALQTCPASIHGNLQGNHAKWLAIGCGSSVGGDVQADHTLSFPPVPISAFNENYLCNTTVGGNVQIQQSLTAAPWDIGTEDECTGGPATVAGNLQFNNNNAASDISNNIVGGDLSCQNNVPAPTGSNDTAKQTSGQCAGF